MINDGSWRLHGTGCIGRDIGSERMALIKGY
jgi:hypothetical protein